MRSPSPAYCTIRAKEPPDPSDLTDCSRATVMRSAASHLKPGGMFLRKQEHFVYVSCLCESGDLLSQWRAYAGGGGFSIGFATASLREIVMPEGTRLLDSLTPRLRVERVRYGTRARRAMVTRVLKQIAPRPVGSPGVQGWVRAQSIVLPALASVKTDAFAEEKEWRLIFVGRRELHFRPGPLSIIPYVEVPFGRSAIKEIVIGPGGESELRRLGVERLLEAVGAREVVVRQSRAPFRG